MIVSGTAIAEQLYQQLENEISHVSVKPHLTIITCAPTAATLKYLAYKQAAAQRVGVRTAVIELPAASSTEECIAAISRARMQTDGIVVQLPLPDMIDTDAVIAAIPSPCDIDGLQYPASHTTYLPPVAGAIAVIAAQHGVTFVDKDVVVVGHGRLVGQPCAAYLRSVGATVTVVTEDTPEKDERIKAADVLVLGTGQPGLITPDAIHAGVVIFDAGTAELGSRLHGDADPACAEKASLFTPVPGGIGPLTIAVLLQNCLQASNQAALGS